MKHLITVSDAQLLKANCDKVREAVYNGEIDALSAYIEAKTVSDEIAKLSKDIYGHAKDEADNYTEKEIEIHGVRVTKKSGARRVQYSEDPVIQDLEAKIKARKKLIDAKLADPKNNIFDEESQAEVELVSIKYNADSLTISYK